MFLFLTAFQDFITIHTVLALAICPFKIVIGVSPQNTTNRFPGEEKQNWQHGKSLTEAYRKERDIFWKTNLTRQVKQRGKCFTLRGNEDRGIQKRQIVWK